MATGVQVWSQTAATNATVDTNINFAEGQAPSSLNDSCRAAMASVAKWRDDANGTVVTGGTTVAYTVTTNQVEAALTAGYTVTVQFNATNDSSATLAVDGLAAKPMQQVAGINCALGAFPAGSIQRFTYSSTGTGQWIAQGGTGVTSTSTTPVFTTLSNSLSGDVTVTSTNYFDGPTVSQGTTGVWFATGTITVQSAISQIFAKLWDGTTVIASAQSVQEGAGQSMTFSLSGALTNPAANIKISAAVQTLGSSPKIAFNNSGNSKDSTLTVVRIG